MPKVSKGGMNRLETEAVSNMSTSKQQAHQFSGPGSMTNGSTGSTAVIGSMVGGGVGSFNQPRQVAPMPPIPKGAIYGE